MSAPAAVGKRVRGARYVHASAIGRLPPAEQALVERASWIAEGFTWNVARIGPGVIVGLLDYPDFDRDAFPALARAASIDVGARRARYTDYDKSANPLILHRKELMVGDDHPERDCWTALTTELEALGLFGDPNRIGRRTAWSAMLAGAQRDAQGKPLP